MDPHIYQSEVDTYIISFMDEFNPFGAQLDIFDGKILSPFDLGSEAIFLGASCLFYITQAL